MLKQESVSSQTTKTTATPVIPESDLVPEDVTMIPTRVATKQPRQATMEKEALKQLAIY